MSGDSIQPALNPALDRPAARAAFSRAGRLHAPDFLQDAAARRLSDALAGCGAWERTLYESDRTLDVPPAEIAAMSPEGQVALHRAVYAQARTGFGYLFETVRISNLVRAGRPVDPAFEAVFRFVNGAPFLDAVAEMTGGARGVYADCQATRYLPGFFLNAHDDRADGKDRLYAYVLNLTPEWRADWGGVLMFLDARGNVAEGFTPAFNALNLFAVPQKHAVSLVAPFAAGARLSFTGWIRSKAPAGED